MKPTEEPEIPPPPRKGRFVLVGLGLAGAICWGGYGHWQQQAAAAKTLQDARDFVPTLRTVEAKKLDAPLNLTLPGETQAYALASISARSTGYVAERRTTSDRA